MKNCNDKLEIFSDDGHEVTSIKCGFFPGHGGKHQKTIVEQQGNVKISVTMRWKKQILKDKSKKTTAK